MFLPIYVSTLTHAVSLVNKPLFEDSSSLREFYARVPDGFELKFNGDIYYFAMKNGGPCPVSVDSLGRPLVFDFDLDSFIQIPLISEGSHEGWRPIDFDAIIELNRFF